MVSLLCFTPACDSGGDESTETDTDPTTSGVPAGSTSDASTTTGPQTTTTTDPGTTTGTSGSSESTAAEGTGHVIIETSLGTVEIELFPEASPITVENFLTYVEGGFYDGTDGQGGTIFHRVIPDFMAQGGGLTVDMVTKNTLDPIVNEHDSSGLTNDRGTVAMARTNDPDSATAQFFVNVADNHFLDDSPGYAVFGQVVTGMDVIDAMVAVPTTTVGQFADVPVDPITITSVYVD